MMKHFLPPEITISEILLSSICTKISIAMQKQKSGLYETDEIFQGQLFAE